MQDETAHLLVIDDDTRLRDLLKRYLSEQGYRVTTAIDAADARAKLKSLMFDLLIVDIMMPIASKGCPAAPTTICRSHSSPRNWCCGSTRSCAGSVSPCRAAPKAQ